MARNSCQQPMIEFANAARPKSASCHRPSTQQDAEARERRSPLKSVNTFARTMVQTLRLESAAKAFVRPAAMRSATCGRVEPDRRIDVRWQR